MNNKSSKNYRYISTLFIFAFCIFAILTIFIVRNILDNQSIDDVQLYLDIYIIFAFLIGVVVALLGLTYLSKEYKRDLLGFTPSEIAMLYSENKSIIDQMNEGIISVDLNYKIKTMNEACKKMFKLSNNNMNKFVYDVLPDIDFKKTIQQQSHLQNKLVEVNNEQLLVSSFPLYSNKEVIGATMIFRSRLEIDMLLDQLSGYKKISKALREQKHEFQNKLHVIMGLIKMKDYDMVNTYINQNVYHTNLTSDYFSSRIMDNQISALFVGKDILSKEFDTTIQLSSDSVLSLQHNPISTDDLVIVIGNLIDNALEAFNKSSVETRHIDVRLIETDHDIKISVTDNAGGIALEVKDRIFNRGISTKKGDSRGTGLHLVSEIVKLYNGSKQVQSSKHKTYIEITLKKVKI